MPANQSNRSCSGTLFTGSLPVDWLPAAHHAAPAQAAGLPPELHAFRLQLRLLQVQLLLLL
jgi:hypothetical protein